MSLSTQNMCETYRVREEREAEKKGRWGSSWEYEDCGSLQKRDLTMLDGLYLEGSLDSRDWSSGQSRGQNRPYRKRHCGYWAFEQSEPSYSDQEEAEENGEDYMDYGSAARGCVGYKNSENVDYWNPSPGTEDNQHTGSPESQRAGRNGEMKGHTEGRGLHYDPEDSKETGWCTHHSGLDDSVGNCGQPEKWHTDHRNFNYNLEDCKKANFYCRNRNNLCQVPENYTNGRLVDFPDLNGVSEGKEFVKYYERDRKVCQNDKICPKAKTVPLDQSDFGAENKGYDTLFTNCESKFQNYRGTDSVHYMKNLEDNGFDRTGMMALGSRGIFPDSLWDQWTGGEPGEHCCGIPQGPSVGKNTYHLGEERKGNGLETWKRNSRFRRTAPSSLRRSEFVQNRKKTQEMTLLSSQSSSPVAPPGSMYTENPEQRMLEKRAKVIEELLQTERDYVRDLEMCIEHIMAPLQQTQIPNIDFEGLFGNMQMVIKVSKQLLADLEISDAVGPVFLDHRDELEGTYKVYCQNHDEAISLLEIYEKDEKIQKHLQDSLADLK